MSCKGCVWFAGILENEFLFQGKKGVSQESRQIIFTGFVSCSESQLGVFCGPPEADCMCCEVSITFPELPC